MLLGRAFLGFLLSLSVFHLLQVCSICHLCGYLRTTDWGLLSIYSFSSVTLTTRAYRQGEGEGASASSNPVVLRAAGAGGETDKTELVDVPQ